MVVARPVWQIKMRERRMVKLGFSHFVAGGPDSKDYCAVASCGRDYVSWLNTSVLERNG